MKLFTVNVTVLPAGKFELSKLVTVSYLLASLLYVQVNETNKGFVPEQARPEVVNICRFGIGAPEFQYGI